MQKIENLPEKLVFILLIHTSHLTYFIYKQNKNLFLDSPVHSGLLLFLKFWSIWMLWIFDNSNELCNATKPYLYVIIHNIMYTCVTIEIQNQIDKEVIVLPIVTNTHVMNINRMFINCCRDYCDWSTRFQHN